VLAAIDPVSSARHLGVEYIMDREGNIVPGGERIERATALGWFWRHETDAVEGSRFLNLSDPCPICNA
jgi:hypothetical protein